MQTYSCFSSTILALAAFFVIHDLVVLSLAFNPMKFQYRHLRTIHGDNHNGQGSIISNHYKTLPNRSSRKLTYLNLFPSFLGGDSSSDDHENSNNNNDDNDENNRKNKRQNNIQNNNRDSEFNIEQDPQQQIESSQERISNHQKKLDQEQELQNTFVPYGDELWKLRSTLVHLSKQLIQVIAKERGGSDNNDDNSSKKRKEIIESVISEQELRQMIREVEACDPEYVYALEKEGMERAIEENRMDDAREHKERAKVARSVLPHFNLHGLWVGNYGAEKGFEMVNITYVGDTLIARKVTGDENVPAGEITFQADLSPPKPTQTTLYQNKDDKKPLSNIILSESASKKWNTKQLSRFTGLGHVAESGFVNSQWMDGQFVYINQDYFSFAWLPLNHQILFGRPSYELTVQMMMEAEKVDYKQYFDDEEDDDVCTIPPAIDDDIDVLNDHVTKCFDATLQLVEECSIHDDSSSCIFYDDDTICCFE